ncbi:MAG: dienelactone hydrolase family protein [Desulfovibrionaceae bacterium]
MRLYVVTEIYGQNEHTDEMARRLSVSGCPCSVVDPYDGRRLDLCSEADAYGRFMAECGHERYARLLEQRICEDMESGAGPVRVVGFSAGASAVWGVACAAVPGLAYAVCFYGSQIRFTANNVPCCPVDVVLPQFEDHYSVSALARQLDGHARVVCHETPWLHGFMNPLSSNYASDGYEYWMRWLEGFAWDATQAERIDVARDAGCP